MGDDSQFAHIPGDRDRWELDLRPADVLLIGSQLAYGSEGTNASAPVLTGSGLRVSLVPTILLSNLPHHRSVHSVAIPPEWLGQVLSDLAALTVTDEIDTVSTGYFADPQQVEVVAGFLAGLVQRRPQLRVVVDPTLGDDDVGAYTDPRVAASLREHLLPLATGLTPQPVRTRTVDRHRAKRRHDRAADRGSGPQPVGGARQLGGGYRRCGRGRRLRSRPLNRPGGDLRRLPRAHPRPRTGKRQRHWRHLHRGAGQLTSGRGSGR